MTSINNVQLNKVIVHKVGNPSRGEELKLSANALTLNDEVVRELLTKYFLSPFNEYDQYRFTHISNVAMNEVYTYVSGIFNNPDEFTKQSALLAQFLYSKSTHVKVKNGELYVAYFEDVPFNEEYIEAIGILKILPHGQNWEVIAEDGVNINKLDKGCLIFRKEASEGFIVCVVDNTNKQNDAQYWVNDFLQVTPIANSYHHTDNVLGMCKLFISNELPDKFEVSKSEQIDMLNRSMEYFKTKDQFQLEDFEREVIHHEEVIDAFNRYKGTYEQSRNLQIEDEFDIHLSAVKNKERAFKSVLKLDKNFHIYIHGHRDLIEKGFDEVNGKNFYKIYFDEES